MRTLADSVHVVFSKYRQVGRVQRGRIKPRKNQLLSPSHQLNVLGHAQQWDLDLLTWFPISLGHLQSWKNKYLPAKHSKVVPFPSHQTRCGIRLWLGSAVGPYFFPDFKKEISVCSSEHLSSVPSSSALPGALLRIDSKLFLVLPPWAGETGLIHSDPLPFPFLQDMYSLWDNSPVAHKPTWENIKFLFFKFLKINELLNRLPSKRFITWLSRETICPS